MKDKEPLVIISEAIATIQDKDTLFQTIHHKLKQWFNFDLSGLIQIESEKNIGNVFWTGSEIPSDMLSEFNEMLSFSTDKLRDEPFYFDFENPKVKRIKVVYDNIPSDFEHTARLITLLQITENIHVPLMNGGKLLGYLILATRQLNAITDDQFPMLTAIGNLIANAVINTRNIEDILRREQFNRIQLEFTNTILPIINQPDVFWHLANELATQIPFDFFNVVVISNSFEANVEVSYFKDDDDQFRFIRLPEGVKLNAKEIEFHRELLTKQKKVIRITEPELHLMTDRDIYRRQMHGRLLMSSAVAVALRADAHADILLLLASHLPEAFNPTEMDLLQHLIPQLQLILENYFAFIEINSLRSQLEQEKQSLLAEMNSKEHTGNFIAESDAMLAVLRRVKQVAPIDTTVLIEGETGVGKELIARALHTHSSRSAGPMVKVNCATLPAQLIESELFGHEKGSFTGATERRIGKFEMASGGTLFLDEIGELPLELQSKLLRVIQEREFERIGGHSVIHSDARIIAATNRNLEKEVEAGRFRSDLFFRLNVFPITIPPLRQRKTDIPVFTRFFLEKYCRRIGKTLMQVDENEMMKLTEYQWPGNVRELEHTIERAVVVSQGLKLDLSDFRPAPHLLHTENLIVGFKSLETIETEHILRALELTNGRVSGEKGAAKLLGINGKTLDSKMRKLGIRREVLVTTARLKQTT